MVSKERISLKKEIKAYRFKKQYNLLYCLLGRFGRFSSIKNYNDFLIIKSNKKKYKINKNRLYVFIFNFILSLDKKYNKKVIDGFITDFKSNKVQYNQFKKRVYERKK